MPLKKLWTLTEIAQALNLPKPATNPTIRGVSIDTRTLQPGDLFVAIRGPQADGHNFLAEAIKAGAGAALVMDPPVQFSDFSILQVNDTEKALIELGSAARHRAQGKIIGVTGSYGKTSIKDALIYLLSQQGAVHGTERSFNNHWGTPLTLARMPRDVDYGVFEMGMNHTGEMSQLSKWVQPQVALINNIGGAHLGNFSCIEDIAYAKAEIMDGMAPGSTIVLNKDGGFYELLKSKAVKAQLRVISFGVKTPGDFTGLRAEYLPAGQGMQITGRTPAGEITFKIPVIGDHWVANAWAILSVLYACGADVAQGAADLENLTLGAGRGHTFTLPLPQGPLTIIDESYNAGPASMAAAIQVLGSHTPTGSGRRVAVLGDMLELGEHAIDLHRSLKNDLMAHHVNKVYVSGPLMDHLYRDLPENMRGASLEDVQVLGELLRQELQGGDVVMFKGSRGQRAYTGRMGEVIKVLQGEQAPGVANEQKNPVKNKLSKAQRV